MRQDRARTAMEIAVISDVHGNVAALDAVLADIAEHEVDQVVNLGEICSGALFPKATADRLMELGMPTIRGNHERQLLNGVLETMSASDRHGALSLRPDQKAWLARLPSTLRLCPDIMLVHGTPASDLEYFLETVTDEGLRPATIEEVAERAGPVDASVILCGHTHIARVVTLEDGRMIVNPGSVGLPAYDDDRPFPHLVESGSPHARYAIVRRTSDGWSATLHAVEYDWATAASDAEANGRADWARALLTGRA